MQVFIAGKGVISAIGNNVEQTLNSFKELKSGINKISILRTNYDKSFPAAEVKLANQDLAKLAELDSSISRTALLSMIAAKEAMQDANIPNFSTWRSGYISANTVGGMDITENMFHHYLADNATPRLRETGQHDSGAITETVADSLGIKDIVTTISTACSSSANTLMYAARLIKNDMLDIAIAGGTDAMSRFTLNGFNSLMILDNKPCTPYDENRNGLNLGEGAGYVVLVSEKVAATLLKKPTATLSGYANANDAYHQTASSPEGRGNFLAMTSALKMSGLNAEQIDYVNLHGTGTANNDLSEGLALQRIFKTMPKVSSTKPFTGHTLGACAGIEAVFSLLAMEHGIIYPNLRFTTKMKELEFTVETQLQEKVEVNNVMSNSFGFGGNCSSLIFSKVK